MPEDDVPVSHDALWGAEEFFVEIFGRTEPKYLHKTFYLLEKRLIAARKRAVDARISAPLLALDLAANTAITIARRSRQAGFGEPDWTAADNQNRNLDDITVCLVGAQ